MKLVDLHLKGVRVSIEEDDDGKGWTVRFPRDPDLGGDRKFISGASALDAVKAILDERAKRGISTVALVEWSPKTRVGRLVVEALTKKKGGKR